MSEVHRFSVVKMLSEAGNKISYDPHGPEIVMAKDYDALAAEAQALREEVAALRARVVVLPEPLNEGPARRECGEYGAAMQRGYNACLRELARLNGLTVSEGLLRRIVTPALTSSDAQDRIGALEELRALLSEDKENGDHAA
ncbi:hypothetical protein JEV04_15320 [Pseudomonas aeruginosa]|nr:hypothetical protein [Pseudomonas aeruginosa]